MSSDKAMNDGDETKSVIGDFFEVIRSFEDVEEEGLKPPSFYKPLFILQSREEERLYLQSFPSILEFITNKVLNRSSPMTAERVTILQYCLGRFLNFTSLNSSIIGRSQNLVSPVVIDKSNNHELDSIINAVHEAREKKVQLTKAVSEKTISAKGSTATATATATPDNLHISSFPRILAIAQACLQAYEEHLQSLKEQNLPLQSFTQASSSIRSLPTLITPSQDNEKESLSCQPTISTNYQHQLFFFLLQLITFLISIKDYSFHNLNKIEIRSFLSLLFHWLLVTTDETLEFYSITIIDCLSDIISKHSHFMIASIMMILSIFDDLLQEKFYPIPAESLVYSKFVYFLSLGFEFYSNEILVRLDKILFLAIDSKKGNFRSSEPLINKIIASGNQSKIEQHEYGEQILQQYINYGIDIKTSPDWYLKHNSLYSSQSFPTLSSALGNSIGAPSTTSSMYNSMMISPSSQSSKPFKYGCYLFKVGSMVPTIRRRWFQWTKEDEMIRYYQDESMQILKGEISINHIDSMTILSIDNWFEWKTKHESLHGGKFRLRCEKPEQYYQWVVILAKMSL